MKIIITSRGLNRLGIQPLIESIQETLSTNILHLTLKRIELTMKIRKKNQ